MVKKKCGLKNPMNTRSNQQLLFGHALTHTGKFQMEQGIGSAKCEHERLVKKMEERGMKHKSPFKPRVKRVRRK